ncbi:hypothetical protein G6F59_018894 [Rhizopus arrhizus]|nr:hypothetical protein G6F59_018894 [Rhizopus arrhizus]
MRRLHQTCPDPDQGGGLFSLVALAAALGARMRGVVDLGQVLEIEVGVDLRGGDVGVAEQFLHATQVTG